MVFALLCVSVSVSFCVAVVCVAVSCLAVSVSVKFVISSIHLCSCLSPPLCVCFLLSLPYFFPPFVSLYLFLCLTSLLISISVPSSISPSIHLSVYISIYLSLPISLYICTSIHLFFYLSIPIYPSIQLHMSHYTGIFRPFFASTCQPVSEEVPMHVSGNKAEQYDCIRKDRRA